MKSSLKYCIIWMKLLEISKTGMFHSLLICLILIQYVEQRLQQRRMYDKVIDFSGRYYMYRIVAGPEDMGQDKPYRGLNG